MKKIYINRKDIARILAHLNVTVKQVEKNEKAWGLTPFRKDLNKRVVQYELNGVVQALSSRNLLGPMGPTFS